MVAERRVGRDGPSRRVEPHHAGQDRRGLERREDGPRLRDRPGLRARHAARRTPATSRCGSCRPSSPRARTACIYNDEFLAAEVGQVGTQFDGLGHIGGEVRYADGSLHRVFYNGFTTAEMNAGTGLRQLGIEHLKPILTRGVLVDLPAYKNVSTARGRLRGDARRRARRARAARHRRELHRARRRGVVPLRLGAALAHAGRVQRRAVAGHRRRGRGLARRAQGHRNGRRHVDERGVAEPRPRRRRSPCIKSS